MLQTICKLCLFKSEFTDEVLAEESTILEEIINEIFNGMVKCTTLFRALVTLTYFPDLFDKVRAYQYLLRV